MTGTPIANVSDTARWVAYYRAMETERPDAIFRDPYARRLAGPEGEAIVRAMPKGATFAWPMIVRTAVMDEIILRAVSRDGVDVVLNLAAGLDARPFRLPVSPGLTWVDADLPGILEYKRQQLAGERPACRYRPHAVDLTNADARRALFREVGAAGRRVLIVTEGLLVYLQPEQVAELARDLAAQPSFRWWLIDLASPWLLQLMKRTWGKQLQRGNAEMHFAPAEGTAFFSPLGWREVEFRSTWEESHRLKREMRFAWLWRFISRFQSAKKREEARRISGIVLLERS